MTQDPVPTESPYQRRRPFRVIVRLSREFVADTHADLAEAAKASGLRELAEILAAYGMRGTRLIDSISPGRLRELERQNPPEDPEQPSLTQYWQIDLSGNEADPEDVAARLNGLPGVELAYVELPVIDAGGPDGEPAPAAAAAAVQANHLDAGPIGSNVRWAWEQHAAHGAEVQVLDVESGWMFDHEALSPLKLTMQGGVNQHGVGGFRGSHGTAAVGIVAGSYVAPQGVHGICTAAAVLVASPFNGGAPPRPLASVLVGALPALRSGDVVLIEVAALEGGVSTRYQRPVEREVAVRDAIGLLTRFGIVVIEPAGNGNAGLDGLGTANGRCQLDPGGPGYVDSGAVMVGGAFVDTAAPAGSIPARWVSTDEPGVGSNYGGRVDCYSWARRVYTSGCRPWGNCKPATKAYQNFNGTSSASAIIAGVAVLVQTVLKAKGRPPLTSGELRQVFADAGNGTPSAPGSGIGAMPDLRLVAAGLGL